MLCYTHFTFEYTTNILQLLAYKNQGTTRKLYMPYNNYGDIIN